MKRLSLILVILIAALQYPLWLGKGSWLRVYDIDHKVKAQEAKNDKLRARNAALDAEVHNLKQGYAAIEERARTELGMIKQNEIFFQIVDDDSGGSASK
jgi:cell division protein FtsB